MRATLWPKPRKTGSARGAVRACSCALVRREKPQKRIEARRGSRASYKEGNERLKAVLAAVKAVVRRRGAFELTSSSIRTMFRGNMTWLWRSDEQAPRLFSGRFQNKKTPLKQPLERGFLVMGAARGEELPEGFSKRCGRTSRRSAFAKKSQRKKIEARKGSRASHKEGDERCFKHRNCSLADKGRRGSLHACRS